MIEFKNEKEEVAISYLTLIKKIDQRIIEIREEFKSTEFSRTLRNELNFLFNERDVFWTEHKRENQWFSWNDLPDIYNCYYLPHFYPAYRNKMNDWANPDLEQMSEEYRKNTHKDGKKFLSYPIFLDYLELRYPDQAFIYKLLWIDLHLQDGGKKKFFGHQSAYDRNNGIYLNHRRSKEYSDWLLSNDKEIDLTDNYDVEEEIEYVAELREKARRQQKSMANIHLLNITSELAGVTFNKEKNLWEGRKFVFSEARNTMVVKCLFRDKDREVVEQKVIDFCKENDLPFYLLNRKEFEQNWDAPSKKMEKTRIEGGMSRLKNIKRGDFDK